MLHLFAPENDMALAFGGKYYTPTPVAQTIAKDLSLLPLWYAQEEDAYVWSNQTVPFAMQEILNMLGVTAQAVKQPPCNNIRPAVWGWSLYITERLARAGIDRALMPNDKEIEKIRNLSGRAITRTILQELQKRDIGYSLPPLPEILCNEEAVAAYLSSQSASILKSPWSSSGRGIWVSKSQHDNAIIRTAAGIIRKQGYIMGELLQEKCVDLAMEFYSNGTEVVFSGYSLFHTDSRGAYQGNLLASNKEIENRLSSYIAPQILHNTRQQLEDILTAIIAPHYTGYLGIDMIIYRSTRDEILLHPCIELNLRMSMGMVARIIADRYIGIDSTGVYQVKYAASSQHLQDMHDTLSQQHPLNIDNGRISSGYLPLTPIQSHTQYLAYIIIEK